MSLILLGLTLFSPDTYAESGKVCVLAFERRIHPIAKGVEKIFRHAIDTRVIIEATPKDLYKCLEDDFEEIVLVSHALQMDQTKQNVNLGYYVEKMGAEREVFIQSTIESIHKELATAKKTKKLNKLLRRYQNLPADYPLYGTPAIVLNRALEKAEKIIAGKFANNKLKLKKFRTMTCFRNQVRERYAFFTNLEKYGIELDQAPTNRLLSFIQGKPVTNFKVRWIKRSLYL